MSKRIVDFRAFHILFTLLILSASVCGQTVTVSYEPYPKDVGNPERGLFQYKDTREEKKVDHHKVIDEVDTPLNEISLRKARDEDWQTVVYRHYYLKNFRNADLDKAPPGGKSFLLIKTCGKCRRQKSPQATTF